MIQATLDRPVSAAAIAAPSRATCKAIATRELQEFLALLDSVAPDEWSLPTACALWDVRDVAAHQAAHVRSGAGLAGLLRQSNPLRVRRYKSQGLTGNDATNQLEVEMRRALPPAAIIREIREGTAASIAARQRMGRVSRLLRVPVPDYGMMSVDYLLHVVFPRDMWIHRLDIADATGREFPVTREHDGALLQQAIADMNRNVLKRLPGRSVQLTVEGPAGGTWRLGQGEEVRVAMDLPALLRRMSGRIAAAKALESADVSEPIEAARVRALDALVSIF